MPHMVTCTINIPQMLASIYHTTGSYGILHGGQKKQQTELGKIIALDLKVLRLNLPVPRLRGRTRQVRELPTTPMVPRARPRLTPRE